MFHPVNPHPDNLTADDCVKRAIALAVRMDYEIVAHELNAHKRITGAKRFNSDRNPHSYVELVLKGEKINFPAREGKASMTGERFCREYPKGNYILDMDSHWTACIDGVIYDTWDPSAKLVYAAYKITPKEYHKTFQCEWVAAKSNFRITVCDVDRSEKKKKVGINELAGYKECLRDFGYHEVLV